jgi:hypothetical protein
MSTEHDWPAAQLGGEWAVPEPVIHFDPADPAKTIPLALAQDMLQRQYRANPASFANKLANAYRSWVLGGNGSEKRSG